MTTPSASGVWAFIVKQIGRVVQSSARLQRYVLIATCSTAELLLSLVKSTLVQDVRRVKEASIQKHEAERDLMAADAKLRLAEACKAANDADLPKRRDAEARLLRLQKEQKADRQKAETQALLMDAETRRITAMAESKAKLIEALSTLSQHGGAMHVNPEDLEGLLRRLPQNPHDED